MTMKFKGILVATLLVSLLSSCGSADKSSESASEELDLTAGYEEKVFGKYESCAGMDEDSFRNIFKVPQNYELQDVSAINTSNMTCVMAGHVDGKTLALMVQQMSTPSTYSVIAAGMKRDFAKAPESNLISGLGEAAVWTERENRKVSGITVVGKDHVVAILFDHYNTRSREELQPMLENYYRHWIRSQK